MNGVRRILSYLRMTQYPEIGCCVQPIQQYVRCLDLHTFGLKQNISCEREMVESADQNKENGIPFWNGSRSNC